MNERRYLGQATLKTEGKMAAFDRGTPDENAAEVIAQIIVDNDYRKRIRKRDWKSGQMAVQALKEMGWIPPRED